MDLKYIMLYVVWYVWVQTHNHLTALWGYICIIYDNFQYLKSQDSQYLYEVSGSRRY